MGIPELHQDEAVILQTQNIKVKSVMFDAVLTNERLMLIDSKKGLIPPQEILITTISSVESGENAIRDPILTFSIFAKGNTMRQMILTFPREASGDRRRERDDWLKVLNETLASRDPSAVLSGAAAIEAGSAKNYDGFPQSSPESYGSASQKKKIELARPRRNIIESVPSMPRPKETTTLPIGTFCSRCGNRVPPESVFCNLCGTKVVIASEQSADSSSIISTTPIAPTQPVVPQVQIPTPPVFGLGGDRKERTLEDVIHSIEPLIEDSVPRSGGPAPIVPRHYPAPSQPVEVPVVETSAGEVKIPPTETLEIPLVNPEEKPAEKSTEIPAEISAESQTEKPITPTESISAPSIPTPPIVPASQPPSKIPSKKPKFVTIAAIAIVILAIIGGVVIFSNWGTASGDLGFSPTPTPTPVPVTEVPTSTPVPSPSPTVTQEIIVTPVPAPVIIIPPNGVWLRITYPGNFSGTYGTPSSKNSVGDKNTGDQFFMVSTINGPVEASIQKIDGSGDELVIEVYKNGNLMKRETTTAPKGILDFQVDLKPRPTSTPLPTQTVVPVISPAEPSPTSTVNTTSTA